MAENRKFAVQMEQKIFTFFLFITLSFFAPLQIKAQCSICAKTTLQMGEKPAKGFNSGIIYLMLAPFAIAGYVGYRWWKGKDV